MAGSEMGKTNLPQKMGRPRWEVAGNEMGRRIYHRIWDFQDGKWQVMRWEDEFTTWHGTSKIRTGRYWDVKTNLPQEMGLPRWEVAGNEMGRRIYHMIWDFKDKNWPVLRWEDEFTIWHGTSKIRTGRYWDGKTNLPQEMGMAGSEMGRRIYHRRWDVQDGKWQVRRWEDEFTTGDGTSKMGSGG